MQAETTNYSEKFSGEIRNFYLPARFDMTDGFLGITQDQKGQTDRILLSPKQVRALVAFLRKNRVAR